MGMGSCEVQSGAGKSSGRRPAGLGIIRNGGCVKPRIIHTYSPKVYKIEPEEFLDLVQKLTGRVPASEEKPSTFRFIETDFKAQDSDASRSWAPQPVEFYHQDGDAKSGVEELAGREPASTQLLTSLQSPRLVTLNFLPMLSNSPSTFNQPRRDQGFTFPSAAY